MRFIETERLYGQGCGCVDLTLLASTLMTPGAQIWTLDNRSPRSRVDSALPTRATRIEYLSLIGIGQAKTAPETLDPLLRSNPSRIARMDIL
jgi:hypothetical protein